MQTCSGAFSERCLALSLIMHAACVGRLGACFCNKGPPLFRFQHNINAHRLNSLTLYTPHSPELRNQQQTLMMNTQKDHFRLFMDRMLSFLSVQYCFVSLYVSECSTHPDLFLTLSTMCFYSYGQLTQCKNETYTSVPLKLSLSCILE